MELALCVLAQEMGFLHSGIPVILDVLNGSTQLLNCQWNSSDIDTCQMLKYQSSEPQTYIFS